MRDISDKSASVYKGIREYTKYAHHEYYYEHKTQKWLQVVTNRS